MLSVLPIERGALIVTGLGNDATLLLRYRIGDIGMRATGPCPADGPATRSSRSTVVWRITVTSTADASAAWITFSDDLRVVEAQFVQERTTELVLRFVPRPDFDEASRRRLEHAVRARVGDEIALVFEPVDRLPRDAGGKLRAVVSSVGKLGP